VAQENQALDTNEQVEIRKEKLETLKAAGKDPFVTTKFDVTHHSVDIRNDFDNLSMMEEKTFVYEPTETRKIFIIGIVKKFNRKN